MYCALCNSGTKSDILKEFGKYIEPSTSRPQSTVEVADGVAAYHENCSFSSNTAERTLLVIGFFWFQQKGLTSIDVVFNFYLEQSIKSATRSKRGQSKQIKVVKRIPLPGNWTFFLHVESNRTELFYLLAEELVTETGFKELVITTDNLALSTDLNLTKLN